MQGAIGSLLGYTPNNQPEIDTIVQTAVQNLNIARSTFSIPSNITTQSFATESDLETFYAKNPTTLFMGLVFSSPTTYSIRANTSVVPSDVKPDQIRCRDKSVLGIRFGCEIDKYLTSGFLAVQDAVDGAIISHLTNARTNIRTSTGQMPLPGALLSPSASNDGGSTQTAIYIVMLSFIWCLMNECIFNHETLSYR